jgi:triacylglycerol lipase
MRFIPRSWLPARLRRRYAAPGSFEGVIPVHGPSPEVVPLPVVLVHGMFGFDRVGMLGLRLHYFRGIERHLEKLGCQVHVVAVPPMASVPARANVLVEKIEALHHDKVDVIAHSLGGLDTRYALAKLGLAKRVRSLVTIGTPHRGTPIASLGPVLLLHRLLAAARIRVEALEWLSTTVLARFNEEIQDVPGVRYASVIAGIHDLRTPIARVLKPKHAYLRRITGLNDGLVPVASQAWGETLAEIEADHFAQVGWHLWLRHTFDSLGLYELIVVRLGDAAASARTVAA